VRTRSPADGLGARPGFITGASLTIDGGYSV